MALDYLSNFPLPDSSFKGTTQVPVTRTEMSNGLVRQQQAFPTSVRQWSVQWDLTGAQFQSFITWFRDTLKGGVLYFELDLPTSAGSVETVSVRFVGGQYGHDYRTYDRWQVTATLEEELQQAVADPAVPLPVWFRPVIDVYGDLEVPEDYRNADLRCYTNEGETITLTVPEYSGTPDALQLGVTNFGLGGVLIVAANGDSGLETVITYPTYMSAATDGYVTFVTGAAEWTTSAAPSTNTGNVTTWPSFKGAYAALTPTGATAAAVFYNGVAPRSVPLNCGWQCTTPPATDATTTAVLLVYRSKGADFRRLIRTATHRLYLGNGADNTKIVLEQLSPSLATVATWDHGGRLTPGAAGDSLNPWVVIGIIWDNTSNSMQIVVNGTVLTKDSGTPPANFAPFDRFESTDSIYNAGWIGDLFYYKNISVATLQSFTTEAYNRWNAAPGLGESAYHTYLAAMNGARVVFVAGNSVVASNTAGTTPCTDGQATRYWQNLVSGRPHMTSAVDSGNYVAATGIVESTTAKLGKSMYTGDLGALPDGAFVAVIVKTPAADSGNRAVTLSSATNWGGTGLTSEICGASSPFDQNKMIGTALNAGSGTARKPAFTPGTTNWHVLIWVKTGTRFELRANSAKLGSWTDTSGFGSANYFSPWFTDFPFKGQYHTIVVCADVTLLKQVETILQAKVTALNTP